MNDRDQRRLDRLLRVQTFGRNNAADFVPEGLVATTLAALDQKLVAIEAAKAEQTPNRVSKATLLDALLIDFKSVARTARAIEEAGEPGFAAAYAVPQPLTEAAARTHATALLGRLEDAAGDSPAVKTAKETLRSWFARYEMAPNFVTDLRADLEALTAAAANNVTETQQGVESTARLDTLLSEATGHVVQLDAAVRNRYARQPDKLAAWASASHVENAGKRSRAATNTTIATPFGAATPAAVAATPN